MDVTSDVRGGSEPPWTTVTTAMSLTHLSGLE